MYEHLGDDLKESMSAKHDKHGSVPCGSGMLREMLASLKLKDQRCHKQQARQDYEDHALRTQLSEGVTPHELDINKRSGIRVRWGVLVSENGRPFGTAETGAWRVMGGVSAAPLGPGLR